MRRLALALSLAPLTTALAGGEGLSSSYQPTATSAEMVVYKSREKTLSIGAKGQLYAAPLVGSDAQARNGDPTDAMGFGVGGAGLAVAATLGADVELYMGLDPLDGGQLDDLRVRWTYLKGEPNVGALGLGVAQVPYSRSLSRSSSSMRFMNKPISSGEAAIGERVGLTAEGQYYGGKLGYLLGVYNGGEEKTTNRAGLAYGARLESAPLGPLAKLAAKDLRVHLGAGFVLDQGPSVTTTALSGDLTVQGPGGWGLFVEYLMDTRAPLAEPILPASLPGTVERNVLIVEGSAFAWRDRLEVVARWEQYDNNKALTDHGDQNVITGGANLYFKGHDLKLQLNHIHRIEREGVNLDNDVLLLGVAAAL